MSVPGGYRQGQLKDKHPEWVRQTSQALNLLYSLGGSPSAENSSFVFSACSPSNRKFCSEAQNRKWEVSRTGFPSSPRANHCTFVDENYCGAVLPPFLKGTNVSICQVCAVNSPPPEERNHRAASFLNDIDSEGIPRVFPSEPN